MKLLCLCFLALMGLATAQSVRSRVKDDEGVVSVALDQHNTTVPLFNETERNLYGSYSGYRRYRPVKPHKVVWPECEGMDAWECKTYLHDYIAQYRNHFVGPSHAIPQIRPEFYETDYYFMDVRVDNGHISSPACTSSDPYAPFVRDQKTDPMASHRTRDGTSTWFYSNGTKYTVPDLRCARKSNAECCDIIWEHGEWMGLDKDGRHLACHLYPDGLRAIFSRKPTFSGYRSDQGKPCAVLAKGESKMYKYFDEVQLTTQAEVVARIESLLSLQPMPLPGHCQDKSGNDQNDGVIVLKQFDRPLHAKVIQEKCLELCVRYETKRGIKLTGCEANWGNHKGMGCYGHTEEVFKGHGALGRKQYNRACYVDPVRTEGKKILCADLKFIIDKIHNHAPIKDLNVDMYHLRLDYYHKHCSQGQEDLELEVGLTDLLTKVKKRAMPKTGRMSRSVQIVAESDGIVRDAPRIFVYNDAFL